MLIYLCLLSCKTFISVYCYMDFGVNFLSTVTLCHYYSGDNVSSITFWPLFFFPTVALSSYDFLSKLGVILTFFLSLHIAKPHPYLFLFIAYVTLLSHSRTWLPNSKFQPPFVMCQLCTRTCVAQGHTPEQYERCRLHRDTYLGNIKDMDCMGLHTRTLWRR